MRLKNSFWVALGIFLIVTVGCRKTYETSPAKCELNSVPYYSSKRVNSFGRNSVPQTATFNGDSLHISLIFDQPHFFNMQVYIGGFQGSGNYGKDVIRIISENIVNSENGNGIAGYDKFELNYNQKGVVNVIESKSGKISGDFEFSLVRS